MLGETVGNYRITGALSAGGMGAVYRAEHTLIGKPAAVKVLLPEWSANRDICNRFFNEAKTTTAIRHPGIVEIFDFGYTENGRAYLVMELLQGEALAARLARVGKLAEPHALGIMRSIVSSLAAAHAAGVVHRDLKPDNVFLVRDPDVPGGERPKLLDFGIAKLADTSSTKLTQTGMIIGTPTYMAPEQCRGAGSVDARADLYALGCILYELLAGRPPFVSDGAGELMAMQLMTPPEPLRAHAPNASPAVEDVVMKLLAKSPADRYASAAELLAALGGTPHDADGRPIALITPAHLSPAPVPTTLSGAAGTTSLVARKPWGIAAWGIAAAIVAAAATVGLAVMFTKSDPPAPQPAKASEAVPMRVIDAAVPDASPPPPPIDAAPPAPVVIDAAPPAAKKPSPRPIAKPKPKPAPKTPALPALPEDL